MTRSDGMMSSFTGSVVITCATPGRAENLLSLHAGTRSRAGVNGTKPSQPVKPASSHPVLCSTPPSSLTSHISLARSGIGHSQSRTKYHDKSLATAALAEAHTPKAELRAS
jgi:hypothetical protein